jgi:hypothetical protein
MNVPGSELSPEVKSIMDRIIASDDAIRQSEKERAYFTPDLTKLGATESQQSEINKLADEATQTAISEMQAKSMRDIKWLDNARSEKIKELQREGRDLRSTQEMEARKEVLSQRVYRAISFLTGKIREEDKLPKKITTKQSEHVDSSSDDLLAAISKLGGLNKSEVFSEYGLDKKAKIKSKEQARVSLKKLTEMHDAIVQATIFD